MLDRVKNDDNIRSKMYIKYNVMGYSWRDTAEVVPYTWIINYWVDFK